MTTLREVLATVFLWAGIALLAAGGMCVIADRGFKGPRSRASDGFAALGFALAAAGSFVAGAQANGAICGIAALIAACEWWRKRRGRKRAPRSYGYKAKASIAALARKAREAAWPRPVPRLAPGGAR